MIEKQLSVFIENRTGRLGEVLQVLKDSGVNIQSLSLADTTEYGLLRLIVDKPEVGKERLSAAGFSSMLTDVLIVRIPHNPGGLQTILKTVAEKNISVEYMYGLTITGDEASVVMKTSDLAKASEAFKE
jgi:hypothetical protein